MIGTIGSAFPDARPLESAEPTFDRAALLDRLGGDEELVGEIVAMFSDQAAALTNDILAALAAGDADALRREAHTLKGAAANVGALRLAALGGRIQQYAEAGQLSAAAALSRQLHSALDAFVGATGGCR